MADPAPLARVVIPWALVVSDNRKSRYVEAGGRRWRPDGKTYKAKLQTIGLSAKGQYRGPVLEGPLVVWLTFFLPDYKVRDTTNAAKQVLDALKGVVFTDDRWRVCRRIVFDAVGVDRDDPRLVVTVEPLR